MDESAISQSIVQRWRSLRVYKTEECQTSRVGTRSCCNTTAGHRGGEEDGTSCWEFLPVHILSKRSLWSERGESGCACGALRAEG